jgi:hypothetical protein
VLRLRPPPQEAEYGPHEHTDHRGCLAGCLDRAGEADRAPLLEKFGDGDAFGAPFGWVFYHAIRADLDSASDWFEKGISVTRACRGSAAACSANSSRPARTGTGWRG